MDGGLPVRSVRVLRNILTNYLRYFLGGLLGFVITPLMVHGLGDGSYGLWVTVFSLTGYFGLFDQGIRPSLVRYLSRDHARDDLDGMSRTVSSALALYAAVGLLALAATVGAAATLDRWLRLDPGQIEVARHVVLVAGASVALGFPLGVFGAALSGLQRYDLANGVGIAVGILRALGFVAVLRLGGGLVGLAWVSLAMNLLGHALSFGIVRRLLPGLRVARAAVDSAHLRMIGAYGGLAFVGALAASITFQTDSLVITAFLGAAAVTPFALAAGLVENVRALVHSATWVLSPTASELDTRGEQEKLHALVLAGAKYSALVSWPVLAGLLVFGRELLAVWVGPRYESAYGLLVILAVPTFLSLPQSASASVLYGVSRHRGVVVLSLLNAAANLALSLWWVRSMGLVGVALGTAIPLLLVFGVAMVVYTCGALGLPLGRYLVEGIVKPGLATLAFVMPALLVEVRWPPHGWWSLAACSFGPWLLFAAVAWRFAVGGEDRARWSQVFGRLFGGREEAVAGAEIP
jgi:O-antigen/teichoic acid export membrane protein